MQISTLSKKTFFKICCLMMATSSFLNASSLPIRIGPPININPTVPDPFLENLQEVMDNHYQTPYYPGGSPDYLSNIYYMSNAFIAIASFFKANPTNDQIMLISLGQNQIYDETGVFRSPSIGTNTLARSVNSGRSWNYGPPVEQIIPLGGTISQTINASLGPGLDFQYKKDGSLIAFGQGFADMITNPPRPAPETGFLISHSNDNGITWTSPQILTNQNPSLPTTVDSIFIGGPFQANGLGWFDFYITADPSNPKLIHGNASSYYFSFGRLSGDLYYTRSEDGGKTFTPFGLIYSMINDPVWLKKNFAPGADYDPQAFVNGGLSLHSGFPVVYDADVVLMTIQREYRPRFPTPFPQFQGLIPNEYKFAVDQAVVRSLDKGKTWLAVAGATDRYLPPVGIYDPGFVNPNVPVIIDGQEAFGFFSDGTAQISAPVVSSLTGRLYLTYEATNPAVSPNFPSFSVPQIIVSVSSDQGATFSHAAKVNQTPTNIQDGAQQAFSRGVAITNDGYYLVSYYDFRNWTGTPGEDLVTNPLQTDAWLAVYRETQDPQGGSTGVGLDFVGEIRLTPESFNARLVNIGTAIPYLVSYITGTPEGMPLFVNENNEVFVVFSTQSPGSPSNINTNGYKGMTIDTNGYYNLFLQRFKFPNVSNQ